MKSRSPSTVCALIAAIVLGGCLIGCDREIARSEKTTTKDGTTTHQETVVKEKPDGTITKEESKSKTSTNP